MEILREKLRLAQARLFGRKSEKFEDRTQSRVFDEVEAEIEQGPVLFSEKTPVRGHTRERRGRRLFPESWPRKEILHDISDAEKVCDCGADLKRIGEETAEKVEIIPAAIFVERHIRPKYACPRCKGADESDQPIRIAPVPPQILPKSQAGPGLLAHLVVSKFQDALPFNRQEAIFRRIGLDLGRNTMCNWMIQQHSALKPLLVLLERELLSGPVLHCDETPLQVQRERNRPNTTQSYMFVLRGGPPERPVLQYIYRDTRKAEFLHRLLCSYRGVLLTDGYAAYAALTRNLPDVDHAGCWAHARRRFANLLKAAPDSRRAAYALHFERRANRQKLSPEQRLLLRQRLSKKIVLNFIRPSIEDLLPRTPPASTLGAALQYLDGQWSARTRFLENPHIPLDNNVAENDIRPFVVGRKNWLFSGSPRGAEASAALYTLVLNAKANGIDPFSYLQLVFNRAPCSHSEAELRALLPQNVDRAFVKSIN